MRLEERYHDGQSDSTKKRNAENVDKTSSPETGSIIKDSRVKVPVCKAV